jgi:Ca2+:H+ antiporter
LFFQLQTHSSLYSGKDIQKSTRYAKKEPKEKKSKEKMPHSGSETISAPSSSGHDEEAAHEHEEEEEETPQLSIPMTGILLCVVTAVSTVTFLIR